MLGVVGDSIQHRFLVDALAGRQQFREIDQAMT